MKTVTVKLEENGADCRELVFSGRAVRRMFELQISQADVGSVIASEETIADYPHDKPYPSRLVLGFVRNRLLHVVVAVDQFPG